MKKVLSVFMAIAMVVSMFSISMVVFAEEAAEPEAKEAKVLFIGTASDANFGWTLKRERDPETNKWVQVPAPDSTQGSNSKPWNLHIFNPETAITIPLIAAVQPTVEYTAIDTVNGYAASGEYSEVVIKSKGGAAETVKFVGLKGTADAPIVITSEKYDAEIPQLVTFANNKTETPAIILEDCEYVTVKSVNVSALNNGVVVNGCSNVTIESVSFSDVAYIDYTLLQGEEGSQTTAKMETEALTAKGSSVLVGTDCENVTISACSFTKCRAGVVADSTNLAEGETASTGISVVDCSFEEMTDAAVVIYGADDVVVSGGTVTKSGTLASAADYDGRAAAAFVMNDSQNATIERVYSTDNNSFINAKASTGRVRYSVSDRDGASTVDAAGLLIYNNTFVAASSLDLNAVVKNNIFDMNLGEKVTVSDGDANCYHWTSKGDRGSIRKNPQFANAYDGSIEGTTVRDNYILSTESPCLGEGVQVEDDMGTKDFYGNEIGSSHNIGAYEGAGVEATYELTSQFVDFFNYIIAVIRNFFENLFA